MPSKRPDRLIWAFALGYFAAYLPFSGLLKAVTAGMVPGAEMSGLALLPGAIYGLTLASIVLLTALGWWKHLAAPVPSAAATLVLSGTATALIIASTLLAYTFPGISIVFALLLMRGAVLMAAPLVDLACGRRVRWFAWLALAFSLAALALAFVGLEPGVFTAAAALNLAAYVAGYVLRLPAMTRLAKVADREVARSYLVRELLGALLLLPAVPALMAALAGGGVAAELRRGFALAMPGPAAAASLVVGALYATLYVFGTLIYLDRRENTFCIPLNRGASLLAGIGAAYALRLADGTPPPPPRQLAAAGLIVAALLVLSPLHHIPEHLVNLRAIARERAALPAAGPLKIGRVFLFVCSGNTCRSAMAEAIGNAELAARLRRPPAGAEPPAIRAASAGVSARDGEPMPEPARAALKVLSVPAPLHRSRRLTPQLAEEAEVIYCMTARHRADVAAALPAAVGKTWCLDPDGDIEDPTGQPLGAYVGCASRLRRLIRERLDQLGVPA